MFHRIFKQNVKGVGLGGTEGGASGLVQPLGSFGRLARVYIHCLLTVLALHIATPFELALALGDLCDSGGVVASPTTHDLTAVSATGRFVTHPASCAQ